MKERNLPTSFWKPQFNNGSASSSGHHGNHSYETYSDQLQQHAAMLNHLIPADWQYSPNLQSAAAGTAGYSRTAAAAAGHYNYSQFHAAHQPASAAGQYWAAASRLAASQAIKGEWGSGDYQASALSTAASLHTPSASEFAAAAHHPYVGTAAMHHYSNMTGKFCLSASEARINYGEFIFGLSPLGVIVHYFCLLSLALRPATIVNFACSPPGGGQYLYTHASLLITMNLQLRTSLN